MLPPNRKSSPGPAPAPRTVARSAGSSRADGFALVISLALMAFLLLLVVALSALVQTESRRAASEAEAVAARAVARLGLNEALGDLQRWAGPDRRATAAAALLDSQPEDPGIQGVRHPHWVGVWDSAPSLDHLNAIPAAGDDYLDYGNRFDGRRLGWLVSGSNPDPEAALDPADAAVLYGRDADFAGDASSPENEEARVEAAVVRVDPGDPRTGRFAFWVSGENAKASVSAFDPAMEGGAGDERLRASFAVAQRMAVERIDGAVGGVEDPNGFLEQIPPDDPVVERIDDVDGVALLPPFAGLGAAARNGLRDLLVREGHDLSVGGAGLLTDAFRGGLRTDLSRLLPAEDPGDLVVPDGVARFEDGGAGRIVRYPAGTPDNPAPDPPTWAQLADFYQSGSRIADSGSLGVTGRAEDRSPRFPVITRFRLDLHPVFERDSANGDLLRIHAAPVVVLWNPFNAPLRIEADSLWVDLLIESRENGPGEGLFVGHDWIKHPTPGPALVEAFAPGGPETTGGGYPFGATDTANLLDHGGLTRFTDEAGTVFTGFSFRLPAVTMAPGEVLSFGLAADGDDYDGSNLLAEGAFPLTPTAAVLDNRDEDGNLLRASLEWSNYYDNLEPGWGEDDYVEQGGFQFNMDIADHDGEARLANFEVVLGLRSEAGTPAAADEYLFLAEGIAAANPNWAMERNAPFAQGRNGRIGVNSGNGENGFDDFSRMARRRIRFDVMAAGAFRNDANDLLGDPDYPYGFRLRGRAPATADPLGPRQGPDAASREDGFGDALNRGYGGVASYSPWAETGTYGMHQPEVQVAADGGGYWGPGMEASDGLRTALLFDVPPAEPGILSLGALRHWPASARGGGSPYRVGAGVANPMVGGTENLFLPPDPAVAEPGEPIPVDEGFLLNRALWDSFFFSGQSAPVGAADLARGTSPWNARYRHLDGADAATLEDPLTAAAAYVVDGAFNVNGTSAAAWTALLSGTAGLPFDPVDGGPGAALPATTSRFVRPADGSGNSSAEQWNGFRALEEAEARALAEAIVEEVKERGPFLTLADFVNRRLVAGDAEPGLFGTLEAAIRASGINDGLAAAGGELAFADLPPDLRQQPNEIDALIEGSYSEAIPRWVTQGDLLQRIAPLLTTRSDTFRIRAYGERPDDRNGTTVALCEAVVQRVPSYLDPADPPQAGPVRFDSGGETFAEGSLSPINETFGRRFVVVSFRWLPL